MNSLNRCKPLLGTYVELSLSADAEDRYIVEQSERAFEAIERVHDAMSFHCPNSELSHLNKVAGFGSECSENQLELSTEMAFVLQKVSQLNAATDGLFDPTVASELMSKNLLPSRHMEEPLNGRWKDIHLNGKSIKFSRRLMIDLGGIAKGFAVDQAINSLDCGIEAVVNAGGDLRMTHWQGKDVIIQSSKFDMQDHKMQAAAIATSASYYNNDKSSVIVNPLQRQPINANEAVSVFADSCLMADGLTKIAWLLGDQEDKEKRSAIMSRFSAHYVSLNAETVPALL